MAVKRKKSNKDIVIGYVRVSTVKQEISPDVQEAMIEEWCKREKKVLLEIHRDIGVSGGAKAVDRPGMVALYEAVQRTGAGTVLVAKRDRLARDVMEAGMIEHILKQSSARVVSAAGEGTDGNPDDPSAMLMRGIIDLFAQHERFVIKARTLAAMKRKADKGERCGQIPYGWTVQGGVDTRKRGRTNGPQKLIEDPIEQRVIANMKAWRRQGKTYSEIARLALDNGCFPRKAEKNWLPTQIRRILDVPEMVGYSDVTDR